MTPPYAELDLDAIVENLVGPRRFDPVVTALCDYVNAGRIPTEKARAELREHLRGIRPTTNHRTEGSAPCS
ncbi:hypothetical protein [Rhodococcus sp. A5(2022)]|uniref:hypothetical protein n=1 Tax=Rhodococcus sp. A5(2022) TaxID=3003588 RepID=UPI0022A8AA8B|nr:hypothetical protein [Rhodococcus sp. A5(2022)]MCZ1075056.1 hypothetical protein [Rhodococcus sp. A5(2022)]